MLRLQFNCLAPLPRETRETSQKEGRKERSKQGTAGGKEPAEQQEESKEGEGRPNLWLDQGFFFANVKRNMPYIFAFFCTGFLGAVVGANFPNNIQIGE